MMINGSLKCYYCIRANKLPAVYKKTWFLGGGLFAQTSPKKLDFLGGKVAFYLNLGIIGGLIKSDCLLAWIWYTTFHSNRTLVYL